MRHFAASFFDALVCKEGCQRHAFRVKVIFDEDDFPLKAVFREGAFLRVPREEGLR